MADNVNISDSIDDLIQQAPSEEREQVASRLSMLMDHATDTSKLSVVIPQLQRIVSETDDDMRQKMVSKLIKFLASEWEFTRVPAIVEKYARPSLESLISNLSSPFETTQSGNQKWAGVKKEMKVLADELIDAVVGVHELETHA